MIETRTETLALTDGSALRVTIAEPDNVVRGGLVVLHEARGVTGRVRSLVRSLAEDGWLTAAPHLYHRDEVDEFADEQAEDQVREQLGRLSGESVLADSDAAFLWLSGRGVPADRQGVIGFDVGGSAALVVAAHRTLGAAVTVGGGGITAPLADGLPALVEVAGELSCPWLGLYGDQDPATPADEVAKLREAAAGARVATDVVRFTGGEPAAAADAIDLSQRVRNWFDTHLR